MAGSQVQLHSHSVTISYAEQLFDHCYICADTFMDIVKLATLPTACKKCDKIVVEWKRHEDWPNQRKEPPRPDPTQICFVCKRKRQLIEDTYYAYDFMSYRCRECFLLFMHVIPPLSSSDDDEIYYANVSN